MTVQFNLLPDIKIQYLKAKRQKHLVVLASVAATVVGISVFVLLLSIVYGLQKKNLSDLNKDIKVASDELKDTRDLTKILTVQNQLQALPALHDKKVVSSRLYEYLSQITPAQASIEKLNVDFALNTLTVSGAVDDPAIPNKLTIVNTYTDTLKFTTFSTKENKTKRNAFSNVVLSSFSRDNAGARYTIDLKFDPTIFDGKQEVALTVPNIISTRSEVAKPEALFQQNGEAQ